MTMLVPTNVSVSNHWSTIAGKVAFERRHTIVPMAGAETASFCTSLSCPHSETYWAVVITDGLRRYEIREAFDRGSERAPEAVKIAGVIIRPGSEVELEGVVQAVAPNYELITDVRNVNLVMDQAGPRGAPMTNVWWPQADGWTCQAQPNQGTETYSQVWYGRDGNYHLGVWYRQNNGNPSVVPVVELDHVQVRTDQDQALFQGEVQGIGAQLLIKGYENVTGELPAFLRLTRGNPVVDAAHRGGSQVNIPMKCGRNRFVQY